MSHPDALETLMQLYDRVEALGSFNKKTVGGLYGDPQETTKDLADAFLEIREALENKELIAWFDEIHKIVNQYQVQLSIYYKAAKEQQS